MNDNPYATPESQVLSSASTADEDARKLHLNYEANVKALGTLYYINCFFAVIAAIGWGSTFMLDEQLLAELEAEGAGPIVALLIGGFAVAMFVIGKGLRNFRPWARIVAIIFSIIGLLGFPVGTIINGAILYLFFSKKGAFVFTPEYKRIMAATPHIKYKTSIIVWIALGILILLIGIGLLGIAFG